MLWKMAAADVGLPRDRFWGRGLSPHAALTSKQGTNGHTNGHQVVKNGLRKLAQGRQARLRSLSLSPSLSLSLSLPLLLSLSLSALCPLAAVHPSSLLEPRCPLLSVVRALCIREGPEQLLLMFSCSTNRPAKSDPKRGTKLTPKRAQR